MIETLYQNLLASNDGNAAIKVGYDGDVTIGITIKGIGTIRLVQENNWIVIYIPDDDVDHHYCGEIPIDKFDLNDPTSLTGFASYLDEVFDVAFDA